MTTPRPRQRQAERRSEAERRLLTAAAELIGEVGPMRTTLADIGERAGYSRSLVTAHFGSKGALVQRIMDTVTTEFHEALVRDVPTGSARDAIREIVDSYVGGLPGMSALVRARIALWADAAASGTAEDRAGAAAADGRFREEIGRRLREGVASGELPGDVDVEGFTTVLVGMLRGVALQHLIDRDLDLGPCKAEVVAFVEGRLRTDR